MNKQYIYKLEIDNNPNYKIMDAGILAIEDKDQSLDSGMVYRRKHDIGYYITESQIKDKIVILLKSNKDLGESVSCKLDLKLMYINQYATKLVCETIFIASDEEEYLHKAVKIKEIENPLQYVLDDYD
jgi:hypothetical protein